MKKLFLISLMMIVSLVSCKVIKAIFHKSYKEGQIIWQKHYDDILEFNDIVINNDNDIILAGTFLDKETEKHNWILTKINPSGKVISKHKFDEIDGWLSEIEIDKNCNLYLAGELENTKKSFPKECKILKVSTKKNDYHIIWDKNTKVYKYQWITSLFLNNDNKLFFSQNITDLENSDIIKLTKISSIDTNGNNKKAIWNRISENDNLYYEITDITIDNSDNVFIVGIRYQRNQDRLISLNGWIQKINLNKTIKTDWEKTFGSIDPQLVANSIKIDNKNNIYIFGFGNSLVNSESESDIWIKKFDPNGLEDTRNWNKCIDGNSSDDNIIDIAIDKNNNVYIIGTGKNLISETSENDWWIKKFDENGNEYPDWDIKIDGGRNRDDKPNCIKIDKNGDIIVAGYGMDLISTLSKEDWEIVTDPKASLEVKMKIAQKSSGFDAWIIKFKGPEQKLK